MPSQVDVSRPWMLQMASSMNGHPESMFCMLCCSCKCHPSQYYKVIDPAPPSSSEWQPLCCPVCAFVSFELSAFSSLYLQCWCNVGSYRVSSTMAQEDREIFTHVSLFVKLCKSLWKQTLYAIKSGFSNLA